MTTACTQLCVGGLFVTIKNRFKSCRRMSSSLHQDHHASAYRKSITVCRLLQKTRERKATCLPPRTTCRISSTCCTPAQLASPSSWTSFEKVIPISGRTLRDNGLLNAKRPASRFVEKARKSCPCVRLNWPPRSVNETPAGRHSGNVSSAKPGENNTPSRWTSPIR